jgi:hypothetical protein
MSTNAAVELLIWMLVADSFRAEFRFRTERQGCAMTIN